LHNLAVCSRLRHCVRLDKPKWVGDRIVLASDPASSEKEERSYMSETQAKPKAMSNAHFKGMVFLYRLASLIWNPERHLRKVPVERGMVVVDYGCGPGRYTVPLSKLVGPEGKVFAVDIQPLATKMVKQKSAQESLTNIEPILIDSYDTGIPGSTADLVLLVDTLHEIGDCDALFPEIHRILKPHGILFMDPGHMRLSKAREIVESTGLFTILECRNRDMLVTPKGKR